MSPIQEEEDLGLDVQGGETEDTAALETQNLEGQEGDETDLMDQEILEIDEGGTPVRLKGSEVLDRISRARQLEEQNRELLEKVKTYDILKPLLAERQAAQPIQPKDTAPEFNPKQLGVDLVKMLEGENGGPEAIGEALVALIDMRAAEIAGRKVESQTVQTRFNSRFSDFETAVRDGSVDKFVNDSGLPFNRVEGYLAMKAANAEAKLQAQLAAIQEAEKKGKSAGEKEALKTMKARGTLRLLGTGGARPVSRSPANTRDYSDPHERVAGMLETLQRMRKET
jgi:hypothetical protein